MKTCVNVCEREKCVPTTSYNLSAHISPSFSWAAGHRPSGKESQVPPPPLPPLRCCMETGNWWRYLQLAVLTVENSSSKNVV